MTAGPSGVNETLSERRFRPFASKTRELSGLVLNVRLRSERSENRGSPFRLG